MINMDIVKSSYDFIAKHWNELTEDQKRYHQIFR